MQCSLQTTIVFSHPWMCHSMAQREYLPSGRCHYLCIKKGVRLESQETCILLSVPQLRKPSMKYLLWVKYHARHWTQAVLPGLRVSPEYTYYKERRWRNSSASMVGRGWPMQLLKQQQRMDTQRASLCQSEYERPWNCGSGVLALAGLSLRESCTDHWTLSKGLWGAREASRSCVRSLLSLSCTHALYFLLLDHSKSSESRPEGGRLSFSEPFNSDQSFDIWLSSVG